MVPSEQSLSRPYTPLPLILACLFATFSPCAGYVPAAEQASGTNPGQIHSLPVEADDALELSVPELLENAEGTLERFIRFRRKSDLFLGLDADMDDRVIYRSGVLIHNLSALIRELREANKVAVPGTLSTQAPATQSAGVRLLLATRRLELLMQEQDRCGLHSLGLLLSAIETLAIELEAEPPGSEPFAPQLQYFFFRDHLPNVVPPDGGWVIVVGPGLWQHGTPAASIVDHDRRIVTGPLDVRRVGIDHAAAVRIDPEWISANAGRCLSLTLKHGSTPETDWRKHPKPVAGESLPLCIPLSFHSTYKLAGFLEYTTPTRTRLHKARSILFENASCMEEKQVSGSLEWELNPGGRLTDMGESALYEAGTTTIDCGIAENRIVCQGKLGPAICGQEMRSGGGGEQQAPLLEQSEWEHIFTPVEEYPEPETHHSWALSGAVELDQPTVEFELMIPREESSEQTSMWHELIIVNGGQQRTLFASPKITVTGTTQHSDVAGLTRITAEHTAAPDSEAATIAVNIEPPACRY